tara:strand:+ start:1251 stop:1811 length:561 start_codon:yes stop_codon:yes gene_type:complete
MRIISGTLKGRLLKYIKNSNTRPLKDNVRENIFNILEHSNLIKTKIKNSNILDLYSGIGSFGIECISRGAEEVVFIEKDLRATDILKENLIKLSIDNKSQIYTNRIENFLTKKIKKKFNIFFLDPPFIDKKYLENLKLIKKKELFDRNHIVIIHRELKSKEKFKDFFEVVDTKLYGRSKVIFGIFK